MKKPSADGSLNLRAADFDLVAPDQRERLVAWARGMVLRLSEAGVEVEATWSDEQPILPNGKPAPHRVSSERGERSRKRSSVRILFHAHLRKHACLAFRLGARAVEVSVEIYPSVHARAMAEELASSLDAFPDQFSLGALASDARIDVRAATAKDVRDLLEGDGGLWIGWCVPREVALAHSALVGEQLGDVLIALAQVFAQVVAPTTVAFSREGLGARRSGGKRQAAKTKRAPLASARPAATAAEARPAFERGTKVRVLSGPFSGKTGVVQELDGRGAAKVMLGLLATRLAVKDLTLSDEGKSRPVLSSSHRKPLVTR